MAEEEDDNSLAELAARVGTYPEEAYAFVREGLSYAVQKVHGPESPAQLTVMRYLAKHKLGLLDLEELYEQQHLPEEVMDAVQAAGGLESLNRHVSGAELCWGLRDYARQRWGMLAGQVLEGWGIRATSDFGRIVFAMIDYDLLQKQPGDSLEDFNDVFVFAEALGREYTFEFKKPTA